MKEHFCGRCKEPMFTATKCAEPGCTLLLCPDCAWCYSIDRDSYCHLHFKDAVDRWSCAGDIEPEMEHARRWA